MTHPSTSPSALARVLSHPRLIAWILGVSLILAWLASLPARTAFGGILNHSKASTALVQGFDVGTFAELLSSPEIPQEALFAASGAQLLVWFIFLLFITGGVYATYGTQNRLTTGEFFHACGGAFWRLVRLTLTSLLPFALVGGIFALLVKWSNGLEASPNERTSDYALWAGLAFAGLLMTFVRAWFDLAQAKAVLRGERGIFKLALRTFRRVTLRLYVTYVALVGLRLGLTVALLALWMRLAPESTGKVFLLMQLIVLVNITTRLWQRAAAVRAVEGMA